MAEAPGTCGNLGRNVVQALQATGYAVKVTRTFLAHEYLVIGVLDSLAGALLIYSYFDWYTPIFRD